MRLLTSVFCVSAAALYAEVAASAQSQSSVAWGLRRFTSLVAFGNSYTDESRFGYFASHNGSAPPVGWIDPVNNNTASGGFTWARYVADYSGANLYDYAVSGASCSNYITPRIAAAINADWPSVLEYEVPAYIADSQYITPNGTKFLTIPPDETVYSIWIGTNDLGEAAFLTDSQAPGKLIPDYIDCVFSALDRVYANGARYFVIMNIAPLQLAPLYATPENGGVGSVYYWPDKPKNLTEISYRMWEQVALVNDVYKYRTPYELFVAKRYPGAHFAIFDTYSLISDIYYHPDEYLAPPYNVTGYINHCDDTGNNCQRLPNEDSFLWFDPLHPSERTDQVIAENFVEVVKGVSKYATYW